MTVFWSIFGLGLLYFATPGPINIETMRRGITGGPWPAFCVQLGAVTAELALGGAVLLGIVPLMQRPWVQLVFTMLSIGVLLSLAWAALCDAHRSAVPRPVVATAQGSFLVGAIAAASSPLTVMMWLSITGVAATGGHPITELADVVLVGLGYVLGALTWAALLAVGIGWGRRRVPSHFWRWWSTASGVILGGYGIHLLWQAF